VSCVWCRYGRLYMMRARKMSRMSSTRPRPTTIQLSTTTLRPTTIHSLHLQHISSTTPNTITSTSSKLTHSTRASSSTDRSRTSTRTRSSSGHPQPKLKGDTTRQCNITTPSPSGMVTGEMKRARVLSNKASRLESSWA